MSTDSSLSKNCQEIHESLYETPKYQSVLSNIATIVKRTPYLSEDTKKSLLEPLKGLKNSLKNAKKASDELFSTVSGMIDKSDNRVSNSHLTIIESGALLEIYQTADDLENVDDVTKRLHRISYLVHRCGSEVLYDCIFQSVEGEESQSNKKQKV